ncbi:MAG: hypothetical protein Q8K18_11505 [Burkholderiales bacterium]|nr:hypothetical protein [Burkholderiales bacterium]
MFVIHDQALDKLTGGTMPPGEMLMPAASFPGLHFNFFSRPRFFHAFPEQVKSNHGGQNQRHAEYLCGGYVPGKDGRMASEKFNRETRNAIAGHGSEKTETFRPIHFSRQPDEQKNQKKNGIHILFFLKFSVASASAMRS